MIRRVLTRTTPATNKRLTTLAQLKSELGVTVDTNDTLYGNIIDYCSNEISVYLNGDADEVGDVTIGRESLSETFYGGTTSFDISLGRYPVGDVESITENGTTIARLVDDEANPAFTYIVKKQSGTIWKLSGDTPSMFSGTVTVAYTAGWILPGEDGRTLPAAIEDACLRFCRVKLDQVQEGEDLAGPLTEASVVGVGDFKFGGSSGSKGYGLPYDVRNLIERYKTPVFA